MINVSAMQRANCTSAQEAMEICYCCGDDLSSGEKKKRRRPLSSPDLKGGLGILITFASEEQSAIDVSRLHTGYVCRSCAGLLERYESLHQQISDKIKTAIPRLPSLAAASENSPVTSKPIPRIQHTHTAGSGVAAAAHNESPVVVVSLCYLA